MNTRIFLDVPTKLNDNASLVYFSCGAGKRNLSEGNDKNKYY